MGSRVVNDRGLGYGSEVELVLSMCEDWASSPYINKSCERTRLPFSLILNVYILAVGETALC